MARAHLAPSARVISDGLACFRAVAKAGCTHTAVNVSQSGERAEKMLCFRWVNTALGNLKTAISGTLKSVRGHYVFRYFAEFQYRFNRRIDLNSLVGRLGRACARAKPRP